MRARILAEQQRGFEWYTTADVARALHVTGEGVRHLVREGFLTCARTRSGLRIFHEPEVERLAKERTRAKLRGVTRLRPKKFGPRGGPRQLSFFSPTLRIVRRAESLEKGQVDHARSGGK